MFILKHELILKSFFCHKKPKTRNNNNNNNELYSQKK